MKHYPFFITEVVFLLLFLAIVPVSIFFNGPFSWLFALVAGIIFVVISVMDHQRYVDFAESVKSIKGLKNWETEFWSVGTLKFDYKGEKIRYSSCVGRSTPSVIPVTYNLQLENGSPVSFSLGQGGKWLGEFSAKGNRKFLDTIRQEISSFNKKYELRKMENHEGLLDISVKLDFVAHKPPPEDKLEDMSRFLKEYLEFGYTINKKLKKSK
ncbi:hypothetical protein GF318_05295 [Candidatus Micrarchaeota archaeon]|nr:hypothetical protein [Candidatus Micrarchaeota archaeon]